jgi:hypothetical protein
MSHTMTKDEGKVNEGLVGNNVGFAALLDVVVDVNDDPANGKGENELFQARMYLPTPEPRHKSNTTSASLWHAVRTDDCWQCRR